MIIAQGVLSDNFNLINMNNKQTINNKTNNQPFQYASQQQYNNNSQQQPQQMHQSQQYHNFSQQFNKNPVLMIQQTPAYQYQQEYYNFADDCSHSTDTNSSEISCEANYYYSTEDVQLNQMMQIQQFKKNGTTAQINNFAAITTTDETKFKTEMCKNWSETGRCNYGNKCRFAHGRDELVTKQIQNINRYKSKECNGYHNLFYCPYGIRCMFQHEYRTVDDIKYQFLYRKLLQNNIFQSSNGEIQIQENEIKKKRLPIFQQINRKFQLEQAYEKQNQKSDNINQILKNCNLYQQSQQQKNQKQIQQQQQLQLSKSCQESELYKPQYQQQQQQQQQKIELKNNNDCQPQQQQQQNNTANYNNQKYQQVATENDNFQFNLEDLQNDQINLLQLTQMMKSLNDQSVIYKNQNKMDF